MTVLAERLGAQLLSGPPPADALTVLSSDCSPCRPRRSRRRWPTGVDGPARSWPRLERAGVPTAGQALVHLLLLTCLRGLAVHLLLLTCLRGLAVRGVFRPFALVNGRAAASWRLASGRVALQPLEPLGAADSDALRTDGERVRELLGKA